jgi:hypothetical protein
MSAEITLQYLLKVQNPQAPAAGQSPFQRQLSATLQITQNAVGESAGVLSVATSAGGTALPVGGVTTSGVCVLTNLDKTNFVKAGVKVSGTFYPFARLKPGETCIARIDPGATVYLVADTAAANVAYDLLQD